MPETDPLVRIATLLAAYRDLDRVALPIGVREGIKKLLDAYAETWVIHQKAQK